MTGIENYVPLSSHRVPSPDYADKSTPGQHLGAIKLGINTRDTGNGGIILPAQTDFHPYVR